MVFVSGATGYIGGAIARLLAASGIAVTGGLRGPTPLPAGVAPLITGDLAKPGFAIGTPAAVIHAAGLGHRRGVPPGTWRRANVDAAANLARAARQAGAQKFILISTAHVHGRVHDGVVTDDTPPNPMDDYAASKLQAEQAVADIFGPGLTIIRPVAVIGPHCPGNLQMVMKLLNCGVPLPFGSIHNQRSFIQVDDLARLVLTVLNAPAPPASILAAHPTPISTPALIRALGEGLGKPARLIAYPPAILAAAAALCGRAAMWQSLAGSFNAAPAAALNLGWTPLQSVPASLQEIARYYNTTSLAA